MTRWSSRCRTLSQTRSEQNVVASVGFFRTQQMCMMGRQGKMLVDQSIVVLQGGNSSRRQSCGAQVRCAVLEINSTVHSFTFFIEHGYGVAKRRPSCFPGQVAIVISRLDCARARSECDCCAGPWKVCCSSGFSCISVLPTSCPEAQLVIHI